jgi:tousled-like kinase
VEHLQHISEELKRQLAKAQKEIESQKLTVTKCLKVVRDLLMEKSTIERKEARSKVMQNRLRLGQFVTQRVGASFQENWTDGHAFQVSALSVLSVLTASVSAGKFF